MKYTYKPNGVCSSFIEFEIENGIIESVKFTNGCSGNTQGVAALAVGMSVEEYIKRCKNIDCKGKGTSCPDQLAIAMEQAIADK